MPQVGKHRADKEWPPHHSWGNFRDDAEAMVLMAIFL